jgi:hypothetical protein
MKTSLITLAGLAIASAAFADVDPSNPMIIGFGNTRSRPGAVVMTNQTAPATPIPGEPTTLDKFFVTGSLIGRAPKAASAAGLAGRAAPRPGTAPHSAATGPRQAPAQAGVPARQP